MSIQWRWLPPVLALAAGAATTHSTGETLGAAAARARVAEEPGRALVGAARDGRLRALFGDVERDVARRLDTASRAAAREGRRPAGSDAAGRR